MAGPIRDRVRQRFASPLFRPTCSADIAQRRGLAALSAALPEATRLSAQRGRCCYFVRAPAPWFPENLTEGSPGRVRPILFVIAFDRRRGIVRLVLRATTVVVGHRASVTFYARPTDTLMRDFAVNSVYRSASLRKCFAADAGCRGPKVPLAMLNHFTFYT